jgi:hypothetical protein
METSLNWLERARLSLLPVVVCNHATPRQVAVSLGHSSAHPAPARPTWPPDSRSAPAKPGTGSCSPRPANGSPASPTPTTPADCKTNSPGSAATRYSHRRSRLHPLRTRSRQPVLPLVSSRYERASLIVTSNKVFGRWGEVFGDDVVAAAMIDRLVHHAEVISLKGDSYRLKDRDLGRVPHQPAED